MKTNKYEIDITVTTVYTFEVDGTSGHAAAMYLGAGDFEPVSERETQRTVSKPRKITAD